MSKSDGILSAFPRSRLYVVVMIQCVLVTYLCISESVITSAPHIRHCLEVTQSVRIVKYFNSPLKMKLLIYSLLLLGPAIAITIEKLEPKVVNVMAGGSFRVMCTASEWYEVRDKLDC